VVRVPTKTRYQTLAKAFPCPKNIIWVKPPLDTDGCILIIIDMDAMLQFFGSGTKEGNDEANLTHVILKGFSEIV